MLGKFDSSLLWKYLLLATIVEITLCEEIKIDRKGYIVFCPCMGRFGNQMDQFLGALAFAKGIERTLVLPHLVEYPPRTASSDQIPFQNYFQVEPLKKYTKVILMDDFMTHVAPKVWPKGKRIALCYASRGGGSCNAKDGNPFGPYWDRFNIDFDDDEFYGPLGYDTSFGNDKINWFNRFPSSEYPVLAFTGAPGAFPVAEKNVHLQKYLKWSDAIQEKADNFISNFKNGNNDAKFIGIHLRNGVDFKNACEHAKTAQPNFFGSAQCLGYRGEKGQMTDELCYPSEKTIIKQLGKAIQKTGAKYVYVATDGDDMIDKFKKKFKNIEFLKYPSSNPHVDLCIIGKSDHAIINCVSTFSAFAKRQRDSEGKTTEFWAFKPKIKTEL